MTENSEKKKDRVKRIVGDEREKKTKRRQRGEERKRATEGVSEKNPGKRSLLQIFHFIHHFQTQITFA